METRAWLSAEMRALGCEVWPSQTNFIYFDAHIPPAELTAALKQRGVLISTFEKSRVSVGTRAQCEQFLGALRDVLVDLRGGSTFDIRGSAQPGEMLIFHSREFAYCIL